MVKNHKFQHHWRKGDVNNNKVAAADEESHCLCLGLFCGGSPVNSKRTARTKLWYFMLLIFLYCCLLFAPQYFTSRRTFSLLYSSGVEDGSSPRFFPDVKTKPFLCTYVPHGSICCDRNSSVRSDVCIMKGDVRTDSKTSSVFLYRGNGFRPSDDDDDVDVVLQHEKIRPYTRKWEPDVMGTVQELDIIMKKGYSGSYGGRCDVHHNVTAVFFSTAGYTGNVYHEFNDGIIPLYVTTQHLNKQVVFVIVDYKNWWLMKYGDVVAELSDYPIIDFNGDNRTHCFPEAIVGLRIHDDLSVDPWLIEGNKTIVDFRNLLDRAYWPRIKGLTEDEMREAAELLPFSPPKKRKLMKKPQLVIIARNGSREITNQDSILKVAEEIGFQVEIVIPVKTSELAKIYRVLNASDVLVGVHGAAMTHFLFMKPGSVFIQIVALGTDWAAQRYYGNPAMKLGLNYVGYKILPMESSLYNSYEKDDPVLVDPDGVNRRGWEVTKAVYLDNQNVRLDPTRFGKLLRRSYNYILSKQKGKHHHLHHQLQ